MEKLTLSPNNNVRLFIYELNENNKKMIEVPSPVSNDSNVLAIQSSYTGLHLEPPTRDVVSFTSNFLLIFTLLFFINIFFHERSILIYFYKNILLFYNNHFVWIINTRKYFNFNFGFLSIILTTTDSINIMMQKNSI